jgi:hypothetical protein
MSRLNKLDSLITNNDDDHQQQQQQQHQSGNTTATTVNDNELATSTKVVNKKSRRSGECADILTETKPTTSSNIDKTTSPSLNNTDKQKKVEIGFCFSCNTHNQINTSSFTCSKCNSGFIELTSPQQSDVTLPTSSSGSALESRNRDPIIRQEPLSENQSLIGQNNDDIIPFDSSQRSQYLNILLRATTNSNSNNDTNTLDHLASRRRTIHSFCEQINNHLRSHQRNDNQQTQSTAVTPLSTSSTIVTSNNNSNNNADDNNNTGNSSNQDNFSLFIDSSSSESESTDSDDIDERYPSNEDTSDIDDSDISDSELAYLTSIPETSVVRLNDNSNHNIRPSLNNSNEHQYQTTTQRTLRPLSSRINRLNGTRNCN